MFIDVEAPKSATTAHKLPVYFYIQGGGFKTQSETMSPVNLIAASNYSIVVVQLTYRIGPYGFLGGREIQNNASANNGLKDQRKALDWIQKHISQFGGDPSNVVLGGASAGGQSVKMQLLAYNGTDSHLFSSALIESGGTSTIYTVAESQFEFDELARRTGCDKAAGGAFNCLRDIDVSILQNKTVSQPIPLPGRNNTPEFTYNPMIDGDFLVDYPEAMFRAGRYVKVPMLIGDDDNEGTEFAPQTLSSYNDTNEYVGDNFPFITPAMFDQINLRWPYKDFSQTWTDPPGSTAGRYWRQGATVYGDIRYTCPGLYLAATSKASGQPTWLYLYNTTSPQHDTNGYGAEHTSELEAVWNTSTSLDSRIKAQIPLMQGYWTSFILNKDPNPNATASAPFWSQYNASSPSRMVLRTGSNGMAAIKQNVKDRCSYWDSISSSIRQ